MKVPYTIYDSDSAVTENEATTEHLSNKGVVSTQPKL